MKTLQQGFTLFEVLVSMFIATVALLGLLMLELTILRSSQSSFNYTLATIEAHTLADTVWMNLCNIENGASYSDIYTDWSAKLSDPMSNYSTFTGKVSQASETSLFELNDTIVVMWEEKKFLADSANDQAVLIVNYPDLTGMCL